MALIDSDKLITYLVWGEVVDEVTCGELKEVIEACTVKGIYTKADMVAILTELQKEIGMMSDTVVEPRTVTITSWKGMRDRICDLVQSKIDKLNTDMTLNEALETIKGERWKTCQEKYHEAMDLITDTINKYQKIKEQVDIAIDKENFAISDARLIQIREIINGNND